MRGRAPSGSAGSSFSPRIGKVSGKSAAIPTPRSRGSTTVTRNSGSRRRAQGMFLPMLATLADAPLDDPQLAYEPKYDGIRAIAEVGQQVRLWSRLGNEKTRQFPEIADALKKWSARLEAPVVLDGEIVALDAKGAPTGFQQLQGRIHVGGRHPSPPRTSGRLPPAPPTP